MKQGQGATVAAADKIEPQGRFGRVTSFIWITLFLPCPSRGYRSGLLPVRTPGTGQSCAQGAPARAGEWRGWESNPRHHDFQSCALPTELPRLGAAPPGRRAVGKASDRRVEGLIALGGGVDSCSAGAGRRWRRSRWRRSPGAPPADPRTPAALPRAAAPVPDRRGGRGRRADGGDRRLRRRRRPAAGTGRAGADRQPATSARRPARCRPATGIVPLVSVGGGPPLPLWRADSVRQHYLPGTNVLRTVGRFGAGRSRSSARRAAASSAASAAGRRRRLEARRTAGVSFRRDLLGGGSRVHLDDGRARADHRGGAGCGPALALDRAGRWADGAPAWARRSYERSLLVLRALTDRRSGAVAAGARDGWAYVWPRDAGAVAIALAAAGYRAEARRVARFLLGLDLDAAARFDGAGEPVAGREAQGDAAGWVAAAAARAAGLPAPCPRRARVARPRRLPGEIPRRIPRQRARRRQSAGPWSLSRA